MSDTVEALKNITDCYTRQAGENPPCVSCDLGYEEEECTCLEYVNIDCGCSIGSNDCGCWDRD